MRGDCQKESSKSMWSGVHGMISNGTNALALGQMEGGIVLRVMMFGFRTAKFLSVPRAEDCNGKRAVLLSGLFCASGDGSR